MEGYLDINLEDRLKWVPLLISLQYLRNVGEKRTRPVYTRFFFTGHCCSLPLVLSFRYIHVVANGRISFFLWLNNIPLYVWVCTTSDIFWQFSYSLMQGHFRGPHSAIFTGITLSRITFGPFFHTFFLWDINWMTETIMAIVNLRHLVL